MRKQWAPEPPTYPGSELFPQFRLRMRTGCTTTVISGTRSRPIYYQGLVRVLRARADDEEAVEAEAEAETLPLPGPGYLS